MLLWENGRGHLIIEVETMSEEIPTEIDCLCGSVAKSYDTDVEKDGKLWDAVYRCSRCGTDTYYTPNRVFYEDMRGLRIPFRGAAG